MASESLMRFLPPVKYSMSHYEPLPKGRGFIRHETKLIEECATCFLCQIGYKGQPHFMVPVVAGRDVVHVYIPNNQMNSFYLVVFMEHLYYGA